MRRERRLSPRVEEKTALPIVGEAPYRHILIVLPEERNWRRQVPIPDNSEDRLDVLFVGESESALVVHMTVTTRPSSGLCWETSTKKLLSVLDGPTDN